MNFVTYTLSDQGVPFYVGKGKSVERAYSHEKYAITDNILDLGWGLTSDYNPYKTRVIRKILKNGRQVEYSFLYFDTEEDAFLKEKELIAQYGRKGIDPKGILTNRREGGIGGGILDSVTEERRRDIIDRRRATAAAKTPGEKALIQQKRLATLNAQSDDTKAARKAKHSEISKRWQRELSPERREQLSEKRSRAQTGKKLGPSPKRGVPATGGNTKGVRQAWNKNLSLDDPRREKHRQALIKSISEKDRQWSGHTPFRLISDNGELVEGNSVTWLVEKYDLSTRVKRLIRGECSSYKGWIRADDLGNIIPKKSNRKIKGGKAIIIGRFDLDGETLIDTWGSLRKAAFHFGISPGTLSNYIYACKPYHGYIWKNMSVIV